MSARQSAENGLPTPREAADLAHHYLIHVTDGWDGYSLDDAAEYTANRMVDFLTGEMTYEADVRPRCDEWCDLPPATTEGGDA